MFKKQLTAVLLLSAAFSLFSGPIPCPVVSSCPFSVSTNPIIRWQRGHFSSDPVVEVIHGYKAQTSDSPRDLLLLLTSTDLSDVGDPAGNWPMNGTRLYWTFGDNSLQTNWYEYDRSPLLQESDFSWMLPAKNHMWAPDVLCVPGGNGFSMLYFFIPDLDKDGTTQRIGVARATSYAGTNVFDQLTPNWQSFQIYSGSGGNPPNNGYAFDPGAFYAQDAIMENGQLVNHSGFFMVYTDGPYKNLMNLSMVQLQPEFMSGSYLGKIRYTNYNSYQAQLNNYMEGPDVHVLTTPGGRKYYYLVFSAQVLPGESDPGYIGYAMATPEDFWKSPATCWKFKGWIFQNIKSARSNQVSLAQLNGHYYAFLHRVYPELMKQSGNKVSRARQVCAKEIELVNNPYASNDGEIVGCSIPSDGSPLTSMDGLCKSVSKNFVNISDETYYTNSSKVTMRLSNFTNRTNASLQLFSLVYYLDIKPGDNVTVQPGAMSDFSLRAPFLKHVSQRTWAITLDNLSGHQLNIGQSFQNSGDQIILSSFGTFDRNNNLSLPLGNYKAWSSRVAVTMRSGALLGGEVPDIATPKYIKISSPDGIGMITYLTASTNNVNEGINNQYLSLSIGTRQQWIMEDASEFPGLSAADKPNAVRLRNVSNGYYMTCDNYGPSTGSYWLLQKEVRPTWDRQVWIKENVGGSSFRFRCLWKGPQNSSTLDLTNYHSVNSGTQQVYVQDRNVYNPNQLWTIADAGSKYLRSDLLQDGDSKHTYATAMSGSADAGINGQYLNTGAQSQEWVFEDARDFTSDPNAVRIRNAWTNYYLTCNHLNKSGDQYHPYYWILNQNLNKSWNTQVWIKENLGGGLYRLKSMYTDQNSGVTYHPALYLTRNKGSQDIYALPLNDTPGQHWWVE